MNLAEEDCQKIIDWAGRHPEIRTVYLYGSRARGDNKPDSDIDLAVEMKPADKGDAFGEWVFWYQEYLENPDLHLSHEVHLEWYMEDANLERVGPGVERDGILLYPK